MFKQPLIDRIAWEEPSTSFVAGMFWNDSFHTCVFLAAFPVLPFHFVLSQSRRS